MRKTLHVHPVYQEQAGEEPVIYDTEINVQSNDLKWKDERDRKVMVEVRYQNAKGESKKKNTDPMAEKKDPLHQCLE